MRFLPHAAITTVIGAASVFAVAAPAHAAGPTVGTLTVINADTDKPISGDASLANGDTLNLKTIGTANLNVDAATSPAAVGSVAFDVDGRRVRLQNTAPYTLGGDDGNGDFYAWTPTAGAHVLEVTPYSRANLSGTKGETKKVSFTVTNAAATATAATKSGLTVSALTLINADTDKVIAGYGSLANGVTLNLKTLPTTNLNIDASTLPATVGSVAFELDGRRVRLQNAAPYSLGSDDGNRDYYAWTPTVGSHTLKVTPYPKANLSGTAGTPRTLTFSVTSTAGTASTPAPAPAAPATRTETPTHAAPSSPSNVDPALRPFSANSPWNTPVSGSAQFGGASDARTSQLVSTGTYINSAAYSIAVFTASATDALRTISSPQGSVSIRVPSNAVASSGSDGNFTIIDPTHSVVDEFWIFNGSSSQRHVRNDIVNGTGMQGGIRASGFSVLGGLIRKWEVDAGQINHAVEMTIPYRKARKGWVSPAISEDNYSSQYAGSIPLGSHFAIPSSVDINSLGLSSAGLMLARTLQTYGAFVGDTSAPGDNGNNIILCAEPTLEGSSSLASMRSDLRKIKDQMRPVL